ncbi:helix-turn-helix domain-containing protein [Micromonospora sp. NBC_01655]|uniref:helix-turn-helix domain-containing protein n=1 Tax=Micromonospora sp. NBC_01655 TaxID=2975983 RepID=UPI00225550B2|nr:helix-turn-helix domain-containing protein [Micromonospora sp. NBC_01655]MCX4470972.1 helix-turn-helix domain-containing protein [Micromonospora sp. NBC_01655]
MTPSTPPGPELLGPLLARLRLARGRSQQFLAAELCAASGVPTLSRHEVSRWERQLRVPGDFWLGWLAVVLAVPVELLAEAAGHSRPARRGTPPADPARPRAGGTAARPRAGGTAARPRAGGTAARPRAGGTAARRPPRRGGPPPAPPGPATRPAPSPGRPARRAGRRSPPATRQ